MKTNFLHILRKTALIVILSTAHSLLAADIQMRRVQILSTPELIELVKTPDLSGVEKVEGISSYSLLMKGVLLDEDPIHHQKPLVKGDLLILNLASSKNKENKENFWKTFSAKQFPIVISDKYELLGGRLLDVDVYTLGRPLEKEAAALEYFTKTPVRNGAPTLVIVASKLRIEADIREFLEERRNTNFTDVPYVDRKITYEYEGIKTPATSF